MSTQSKIKTLTAQLYPRGRAFRIPIGGIKDKLTDAINVSEAAAYDAGIDILDVILPDNDNFTADDAARWEEALGLITNDAVSLSDRMLAIKRKMNHPGEIPARQNWLYLEQQLQSAGFDVYVYENNFGGLVLSPTDLLGNLITGLWDYGSDSEYGEVEYGNPSAGSVWEDCVANYIDEIKDKWFDVGANLRNVFYISGPYIDQFADVPAERKDEFRQMILRIMPRQTVCFLFVNYIV